MKTQEEYTFYYLKNKLLKIDGNSKIEKNTIPTFHLSFLPNTLNSKKENLCTFSTKECRDTCLVYTGRGIFNKTMISRKNRTEYYINYKEQFIHHLYSELYIINTLFKKSLVRLNTFSDINWKEEFQKFNYNIENLSNIIFYDYTKNPSYILNKAKNQEFTFSFSGYNWNKCKELLDKKICNVSVIFKNELPTEYKGYKVLNGDETDMRLSSIDGVGNIIGLKYKNPKNNKKPLKSVV